MNRIFSVFILAILFSANSAFALKMISYKETASNKDDITGREVIYEFPNGNQLFITEYESSEFQFHATLKNSKGKIIKEIPNGDKDSFYRYPDHKVQPESKLHKDHYFYQASAKDRFVALTSDGDTITIILEDGSKFQFYPGCSFDEIQSLIVTDVGQNIITFDLKNPDERKVFHYDLKKESYEEHEYRSSPTTKPIASKKSESESKVSSKVRYREFKLKKKTRTTRIYTTRLLDGVSLTITQNKRGREALLTIRRKQFRLPLNFVKLATDLNSGLFQLPFKPLAWKIENEKKEYLLISFKYDEEKGSQYSNAGETYLFEPKTGTLLKIAYQQVLASDKPYSIDDGILSIHGVFRKIDLRDIDGETSFFTPTPVEPLMDEEGKEVNVNTFIESKLQNISEDLRLGIEKPYELNEEDLGLIDHLHATIKQKESPNPVLVADAGTGKTAVVTSFLDHIVKGKIQGLPRTIRALNFQKTSLEQGATYVGELDKRLKSMEYLARYVPVILFGDEAHNLRGAGTHEGNPHNDVMNMIKDPLLKGLYHMIGTSTIDEFDSAFSGDPALMRRFNYVVKPTPTRAQVLKAIDGWTKKFNYPPLTDETKDFLIVLSNKFIAYGAQPSKATNLLDRAYSRKLNIKKSTEALLPEDLIEALIASGVDSQLFDKVAASDTLQNFKRIWEEKMAGQKLAYNAYYELETMRLGGLLDPQRPPSVLVLGPRGAGKTRGASIYAEASKRQLVKFNMADYAEGGVDVFQKRLAQELFKDRFAIFLFDEIEKADAAVKNVLLAILQDGKIKIPGHLSASAMTANSVVKLDFTQTTIVCTSNAGEDYVVNNMLTSEKRSFGFDIGANVEPDLKQKIRDSVMMDQQLKEAAMIDGLSAFLLDRFNVLVPAYPPSDSEFRDAIEINLDQMLSDYEKSKGYKFELINRGEFLDFAAKAYFHENMSNRIIESILRQHFRIFVSETLALRSDDKAEVEKVTLKFNVETGQSEVVVVSECETALTKIQKK